MKKIIVSLLAAVFCLMLLTPSVFAGQRQRNIWEGVAIGAGAVLLGHALLNANRDAGVSGHVTVVERGDDDGYYHDGGYWTVRRVWVPPVRERIWQPAHYDRYGEWIGGHWIVTEKRPGYWTRQRIWVCGR